jgi:hypothetical protein
LGPWQNPDPEPGKQNKEEINVFNICMFSQEGRRLLQELRSPPRRSNKKYSDIFFLTITLF